MLFIKRQIPNIITLCNLICGILATYFALNGQPDIATLLILAGIFFDFFDGLTARLLGVASPLGKELDSLADVVTSGVAPGTILIVTLCTLSDGIHPSLAWLPAAGLLLPAFTAYRLAKFNLDTRQSHSFRGLPAPANALLWAGIGYTYSIYFASNAAIPDSITIIVALLSLATDILMVSDIPMFSLKFNLKDLSWHTNVVRYIFLIGCLVLIAVLRSHALAPIVLWYIYLSLLTIKRTLSDDANPQHTTTT